MGYRLRNFSVDIQQFSIEHEYGRPAPPRGTAKAVLSMPSDVLFRQIVRTPIVRDSSAVFTHDWKSLRIFAVQGLRGYECLEGVLPGAPVGPSIQRRGGPLTR